MRGHRALARAPELGDRDRSDRVVMQLRLRRILCYNTDTCTVAWKAGNCGRACAFMIMQKLFNACAV